jgi:hypothetical protein
MLFNLNKKEKLTMPHFDEHGHDTWLCQVCKQVFNSCVALPKRRPDITGSKSFANVCAACVDFNDNYTARVIVHARAEGERFLENRKRTHNKEDDNA